MTIEDKEALYKQLRDIIDDYDLESHPEEFNTLFDTFIDGMKTLVKDILHIDDKGLELLLKLK
jgi:hypothetical protein